MATNKGFTSEPEPDYDSSVLNMNADYYSANQQARARISSLPEVHLVKRHNSIHGDDTENITTSSLPGSFRSGHGPKPSSNTEHPDSRASTETTERPRLVVHPRTIIDDADAVPANDGSDDNKEGCESDAHFAPANFYCRFICNHPKLSFSITLGLHLAMIVLTAILKVSGYNIAPTYFEMVPLDLLNEDVYLRQMAWNSRDESELLYDRSLPNHNISERSIRHASNAVIFIYEAKQGNIFTKENLQTIKDFEDKLYLDEQYKKYCVLLDTCDCEKVYSLMRYFDGTYYNVNPVFNDSEFINIVSVISAANSESLTQRSFQFFLGTDSVINGSENIARSSTTRSILNFGYPLNGFNSTRDPDKVQANSIEEFVVNTYTDNWKSLYANGLSGLNFAYGNNGLQEREIAERVIIDMLFIAGSFMFIFIFMWIQTSSLWLTAWGMGSTVLCLVTGNLIYNIVFDFKYLGIFHVLALFILLGIGADDVFIFCETWKAQRDKNYPTLAHRLSAAYRKAAGTMLVTSLTTAAAFFTSSFSPILTVSSFGTFAGIIVLVNFLSIIIFYPTVLIIWHLNWEHKPFCLAHCFSKLCHKNSLQIIPPDPSVTANRHGLSRNAAVWFLSGPYFRIITNQCVQAGLLVAFTALLGTCIYFVTKVQPDDEQVEVMKEGNNLQTFRYSMTRDFLEGRDSFLTQQNIVWGLKNQDMSDCHPRSYDPDCTGKTVWDNVFDLNPPRAQKALLDFCFKLLNMSESETSMYKIKRNIATNIPEVECFMKSMDEFFQREAVTLYANASKTNVSGICQPDLELRLPLTQRKMQTFLGSRPDLYRPIHTDFFQRYFETALSYWLANGYRDIPSNDKIIFEPLLGESLSSWDSDDIINKPGIKYGTQLRYAAIAVNLTISGFNTQFTEGLEVYGHWEKFITDEMSKLPPSLQNGFHVTTIDGHWFHVEKLLVRQGITAILAGLAVGWIFLIAISGNFIVGTMAAFTIACVSTCVVGLIPILGWKLGVLQSLNMTLVVGLSVDYVVHLGVAYTYAPVTDRKRRVQYALNELGLSVVSGAITTLGSGFFMLFAQITFFMQFGIFIFATIGFSILFAMVFFLVLLSLIGPQGTTGMTAPIMKKIVLKLRGKTNGGNDGKCTGNGYANHKIRKVSIE